MSAVTIVSNRLPVRLERGEHGWRVRPSDGGLVGALEPVLRARGGAWFGWTGTSGALAPDAREALERHGRTRGFALRSVSLSAREHRDFYQGACNEVLWPLLHGLPELSRLGDSHAAVYRRVNARFALALAAAGPDVVWIHDYHLLMLGEELRRLLPSARLGFFLHTPFPEADVMLELPWGGDLIASMDALDLIGFQTERDRRNFLAWIEALGHVGRPGGTFDLASRTGAFPISVDGAALDEIACSPQVVARAREIRAEAGGRRILLGVDRLDYTKGIPERLTAFEMLLEKQPELRHQVVFRQLAVPSRTGIAEYDALRERVERAVARINASHASGAGATVHYEYGTWNQRELLANYIAADVGVVNPVRDGMNLVAKEFAAVNQGEGVLVLGRGAGAWEELGAGAVGAQPGDAPGLAAALQRALDMPTDERRDRARHLRERVRANDVHRWAESFLSALETTRSLRTAGQPLATTTGGRSAGWSAAVGGDGCAGAQRRRISESIPRYVSRSISPAK